MFWIAGALAVLGGLIVVSRRRNKRPPTYDATTQGRIDDHLIQRGGDNMQNRFYDGNGSF